MRNEVQRLNLLSYVRAFFPSNFDVSLRRSLKDPDDQVLIVRDVITDNAATYEGSLLSILDICSMGNIAEELCCRLNEQASRRRKAIS
ncbi:hypothetical protein [Pseudomonas oryzihabitans]|uniref:hypothetical protein n=1 Tax=Pseudomonas oryzihabitans TaxID=47885 RepID=UPI00241DE771|nr:hypothetical protein [Pseudomonas oryzihabitans]